jgi:hypothetical protein
MDSPTAALIPVVENAGFTLIEEDDVAFTLGLCREIYRIYGTYQDGDLGSTEGVRAGLVVTIEMLAALRNTVTEGMPAMRIEVAAAQTREMMATLFGERLPSKRLRAASQDRLRLWGGQASPSLAAPNLVGFGVGAPRGSPFGDRKELVEHNEPASTTPVPEPSPPTSGRWATYWRKRFRP